MIINNNRDTDSENCLAIVLDTETTGMSPRTEELIELGVILFSFQRATGEVQKVVASYNGLREPNCYLSSRVSAIHGITREAVRGKDLDYPVVQDLFERAEFIIAHNASFDRGFVQPLFPVVNEKLWYCSMNGVKWKKKGFASKGLQNLLADHHIATARKHRAMDDAQATLELLTMKGLEGNTYLYELLCNSQFYGKLDAQSGQVGKQNQGREEIVACRFDDNDYDNSKRRTMKKEEMGVDGTLFTL